MSFANLFIFLHIFTMFMAVALSIGTELVLHRVAITENVAAIRTTFSAAQPLARAMAPVYGIGFLLGLIAAITGSFNLLAPWLLIAYVLFVVSSILGGRVIGGWATEVGKAAATIQGEAASTELQQLVHDTRITQAIWINAVVIALIVLTMVFKPFGI
jgi:hypothetical protein